MSTVRCCESKNHYPGDSSRRPADPCMIKEAHMQLVPWASYSRKDGLLLWDSLPGDRVELINEDLRVEFINDDLSTDVLQEIWPKNMQYIFFRKNNSPKYSIRFKLFFIKNRNSWVIVSLISFHLWILSEMPERIQSWNPEVNLNITDCLITSIQTNCIMCAVLIRMVF